MSISFDKSKFKNEKTGDVIAFEYEDKDIYVNSSEMKKDELKKYEHHNSEYTKAFTTTAKELAEEAFNKDKDLNKAVVTAGYSTSAYGYVEASVYREVETPDPSNPGNKIKQPKIRLTVKDPSVVHKSFVKGLVKDLKESLK